MEAEFFEQFKTVDDAATTAATTDLRAAKLHRVDTIALEADITNRNRLAS